MGQIGGAHHLLLLKK
jgi:hypothetical protein